MSKNQCAALIRCCFCIAVSIGLVGNCIGIFFAPIANELNVGIGEVSACVMVSSVSAAISSLAYAKLRQRFEIKHIMCSGVWIVICGFLLMALAKGLPLLYLGAFVLGLGGNFFGPLAVTGVLRDAFGEKNGTALGIVLAVAGIAGAIISPILGAVIARFGFAGGFYSLGILSALSALPAILTMPKTSGESTEEKTIAPTVTCPMDKPALVLLFVIATLLYTQNGLYTHMSSIAVSSGYSLQFSSLCASSIMIGDMFSKFLFGRIADKSDVVSTTILFLLVGFSGTCLLFFRNVPLFMILAPALFGANSSCSMLGMNLLCQSIAKEKYVDIYAKLNVVAMVAYACGTTLYGFISDAAGYQPALYMAVTFGITEFLLLVILRRHRNKEA